MCYLSKRKKVQTTATGSTKSTAISSSRMPEEPKWPESSWKIVTIQTSNQIEGTPSNLLSIVLNIATAYKTQPNWTINWINSSWFYKHNLIIIMLKVAAITAAVFLLLFQIFGSSGPLVALAVLAVLLTLIYFNQNKILYITSIV